MLGIVLPAIHLEVPRKISRSQHVGSTVGVCPNFQALTECYGRPVLLFAAMWHVPSLVLFGWGKGGVGRVGRGNYLGSLGLQRFLGLCFCGCCMLLLVAVGFGWGWEGGAGISL